MRYVLAAGVSGSPDGAQAYLPAKTQVGYIDTKNGRHLVHTVFVNDVPVSSGGSIVAAIQQGY